jgi:predicted  nucleic acid-binding Zn-ribbon protein
MPESPQNGWNEYSRLVLKELETLSDSIKALGVDLQGVKQEIAAMRVKEDKVNELRSWKEKIDEITSPTQLKEITIEIEGLKQFKTRAVTVFAVVQFLMAAVVVATKVFG